MKINTVIVHGCGDEPIELDGNKLETLNFSELIKADIWFNDLKVHISRDVLFTFKDDVLTIDVKELMGVGKLLEYLGELQTLREKNAELRKEIKTRTR